MMDVAGFKAIRHYYGVTNFNHQYTDIPPMIRPTDLLMETSRMKPAERYSTSDPNEPVKIRIGETGLAAEEPLSVPALMETIAGKYSHHIALCYQREGGGWCEVNYRAYQEKVFHISKAFIKLGLEPRCTVGVMAFNCPEWFYSEFAAIHANGIIAGIYTTNSPDVVFHLLESSSANIVVVDEPKQMEKIREIRHRLPKLKAAIQILGPFADYIKAEDGYYKWSEIEEMDVTDVEEDFKCRLESIAVNECCSLIYTSGTVGMPKGVMLSHDNITFEAKSVFRRFGTINMGREAMVSYLPLSHIAAQTSDVFLMLLSAGTIYFADRDALKGTLLKTLTYARPTYFGGVPRIFEKIEEKFAILESQITGVRKTMMGWGKRLALEHHEEVLKGNDQETISYKFAKMLVLNKIKSNLGFDRCKLVFCGAAPLSRETKSFFLGIDIRVLEAYGLSETTAGHCMSDVDASSMDTVGQPLEGAEIKVFNPDEDGAGELLLRGRNVFIGYIHDPEKTIEAFNDDGWMQSGDIGKVDEKGYAYVTGRLKEIIITAGGENIPPVHVEQLVKRELPGISHAFLIGDQKKFLSMLITIKTDIDKETGDPLPTLQPEALMWMQELSLPYTTLTEILDAGPCPIVIQSIQDGIDRANKVAISNAQKVQKFVLLPHDFSIPTGELGPTFKVKRNMVLKEYEEIIDGFYKN